MYILYILNNTVLSNIVSSIYKIIIYIGTVYEKCDIFVRNFIICGR